MAFRLRQSLIAFLAFVAAAGCRESFALQPDVKTSSQMELRDIEGQIAVKTKELNELRKRADEVRAKMASPSTLAGLQKVLESIPVESRPRADDDGAIERDQANQWLATNLVGSSVAFKADVGDVGVFSTRGNYVVNMALVGMFSVGDVSGLFVGTVKSGGADWSVFITPCPSWRNLDVTAAKRLRDLKGKSVIITGIITKDSSSKRAGLRRTDLPAFVLWPNINNVVRRTLLLHLSNITIDGFDPLKGEVKVRGVNGT